MELVSVSCIMQPHICLTYRFDYSARYLVIKWIQIISKVESGRTACQSNQRRERRTGYPIWVQSHFLPTSSYCLVSLITSNISGEQQRQVGGSKTASIVADLSETTFETPYGEERWEKGNIPCLYGIWLNVSSLQHCCGCSGALIRWLLEA